jgi:hypothetical protein
VIARVWIIIALSLFAGTSAGCTVNLGGPAPPAETIPVSADAAAQAKKELESALGNASGGVQLTLSLNEVQLTALLAERLAAQTDSLNTNPQVYLRDGEMEIYGMAKRGPCTLADGL